MTKIDTAMRIVSAHLDKISREVFKPGAKLTFIARYPGEPECDFFLSEDDIPEVAELLIRTSKRDAEGAPHD